MKRIKTRVRPPSRRRASLQPFKVSPPTTPVFWGSAILLTLAFVLGGASRGHAFPTMAIELVGVGLIAANAWQKPPAAHSRNDLLGSAVLAGLFIVPLLQLIPLPPTLWTALPGREAALETLRLAGIRPAWAPISLDPEATFRSMLWLIPPAALFIATRGLDLRARFWLAGLFLGLCITSLVLGGGQITDGTEPFFKSAAEGRVGLPIGFFANRNHQGIAMAAALPFAAALATFWGATSPRRIRAANFVFTVLAALLVVGVLVTRSRGALVIAGPALIGSLGLFWRESGAARLRREFALMIAIGSAILVLAAQFAISAVFERFVSIAEGDARFAIWAVTLKAASDVAPVGAGLGTFEPFYRAWEPLALMRPQFINHAHNDYLELWLETGWFAPVVLAGFLVWLGRNMWTSWSGPTNPSALLTRAGGFAILVLLAHSVVDYPLRTHALACVFAYAAGCLPCHGRQGPEPRSM